MSTLTKEEKKLRNSMPITGYRCTTHHYACHCINRGTMDLIDRLVAENEELRKDNLVIYGKITAILSAVEPIIEEHRRGVKGFSASYLNNLKKAVKEAKGDG